MAENIFDAVTTDCIQPSSCDQCKARKTKCNRKVPCDGCTYRSFTCTYRQQRKPRSDRGRASLQAAPTSLPLAESLSRDRYPISPESRTPLQSFRKDRSSAPSNKHTPSPSSREDQAPTPNDEHTPSQLPCSDQDSDLLNGMTPTLLSQPPEVFTGGFELSACAPGFSIEDTPLWGETVGALSPMVFGQAPLEAVGHDNLGLWASIGDGSWTSTIPDRLMTKVLRLYFRQIHPSIPLFKPSEVISGVARGRHKIDRQFGAMILALCTFTLLQPQEPNASLLATETLTLADFLHEALALHNADNYDEGPTLDTLLTSINLFGALELLHRPNAAWLKLQEAIAISEILDLPNIESHLAVESEEWQRRTRVYLCLTVIERAFVVGRWRRLSVPTVSPTLLHKFSRLSLPGEPPADKSELKDVPAIRLLVETFSCLDDEIISCWGGRCGANDENGTCDQLSPDRILYLMRKVPRWDHKDWLHIFDGRSMPPYGEETNEQGDVLLTCLWVLNRLWHMALSHDYVSCNSPYMELQPSFAVRIAAESLAVCKSFSMKSLEMHGIGLDHKLYDIASDFMHLALSPRTEVAISGTSGPQALQNVEPQPDFHSFPARNGLYEIDKSSIHLLQETPDFSTASPMSISEIANGFLGFFALFKNGQHKYFNAYMDLYNKFV